MSPETQAENPYLGIWWLLFDYQTSKDIDLPFLIIYFHSHHCLKLLIACKEILGWKLEARIVCYGICGFRGKRSSQDRGCDFSISRWFQINFHCEWKLFFVLKMNMLLIQWCEYIRNFKGTPMCIYTLTGKNIYLAVRIPKWY